MILNGSHYIHDIGMVTTTGTIVSGPQEGSVIVLAEGSTDASITPKEKTPIEAEIVIAEAATSTTCVRGTESIQDKKPIILHNPMIEFWKRAVLYFNTRKQLVDKGYILRFEDTALIISDLGQSLYILFGRHWHDGARAIYTSKVGTPPTSTPDLLSLLEKYYPSLGWDLPRDSPRLWDYLHAFVLDYYQDIVKHFDHSKFEKALSINLNKLASFMEITRRTWIWFIEKRFEITFDVQNDSFRHFKISYYNLT